MARLFAVLVYLGGAIASLLLIDGGEDAGLITLAGASIALGWMARWWPAAWLAFVLVPLALPLGEAESEFGEALPTVVSAGILIPISAALVLLATAARRGWDRRKTRRASAAS
jgi:hypothetical protein